MGKILSQSGVSLSDLYDIQGSIAGVDQLLSEEVNLVHDMGETMFSERLVANVRVVSAGALAQNITWNVALDFGAHISRILGVALFGSVAGRIANAAALISDFAPGQTDCPILAWDSNMTEVVVEIVFGGFTGPRILLQPVTPAVLPNIVIGIDYSRPAPLISFRGRTSAFGAGSVEPLMALYSLGTQVDGISSNKGLPVPSW